MQPEMLRIFKHPDLNTTFYELHDPSWAGDHFWYTNIWSYEYQASMQLSWNAPVKIHGAAHEMSDLGH